MIKKEFFLNLSTKLLPAVILYGDGIRFHALSSFSLPFSMPNVRSGACSFFFASNGCTKEEDANNCHWKKRRKQEEQPFRRNRSSSSKWSWWWASLQEFLHLLQGTRPPFFPSFDPRIRRHGQQVLRHWCYKPRQKALALCAGRAHTYIIRTHDVSWGDDERMRIWRLHLFPVQSVVVISNQSC